MFYLNCRNKRLKCYDWWRKTLDQLVKNNLRTYDSIGESKTGQGDHWTTGSLQNYNYFKDYYKATAIDLNKQ